MPTTLDSEPTQTQTESRIPVRTQVRVQPQQFKHFGVMERGHQSKSSVVTSITVNVLLALLILVLGAAARKQMVQHRMEATLVVPLKEKPPEPVKPKVIPPRIIPPKLMPKPVEPKIKLPDVKMIEPPKPVQLPPQARPLPAITPAPPKQVVAAAAPKPVTVHLGQSASVVNHDEHPSAVALGRPDNPIAPSNRPATSAVNLGQRGLAGMPATNMGGGPPSTRVSLGSGQPNGSMGGTGSRAVQGVKLGGVTGGTGTTPGNGIGSRPAQVQLGRNEPPPTPQSVQLSHPPARQGPQVTYKPRPVYTAEATALHLEGVVSVRIRVSSTGAVSVIGVTSGLGHGLDQSAVQAVEATRFKPALDAQGRPTDWEGVVNISFQMAT